ncbi:hypothetical protein CGMCC3_g4480 [Colletotrichum fructicola]|nr:uncharacterized protein CGMCC3_g4480 [Colletotrichum fructicola]KAE9579632.1 hypothetical protein CGMCC3_g4480 [Colletotrichum fructicola]
MSTASRVVSSRQPPQPRAQAFPEPPIAVARVEPTLRCSRGRLARARSSCHSTCQDMDTCKGSDQVPAPAQAGPGRFRGSLMFPRPVIHPATAAHGGRRSAV